MIPSGIPFLFSQPCKQRCSDPVNPHYQFSIRADAVQVGTAYADEQITLGMGGLTGTSLRLVPAGG
ncbi:MAG: hypothetical protein ACYDER_29675, partial [Ktedonobacteraceae bacterium]